MATSDENKSQSDPVANFAGHLRGRRQLIEMSQVELADTVGELGFPMAQQTIAKIESGKRPVRLDEASALARAVGLTLPQMLMPPETLAPSVLRDSLRRSRARVAKLEQDFTAAEEQHKAAVAVADEAAERLAAVRRQLALERDAVETIGRTVDQLDNESKGARRGKHQKKG